MLNLSESAQRPFCSVCRSPIYMRYHRRLEGIGIVVGTIGKGKEGLEEQVKSKRHIFVGDKAKWLTVGDDGLKRRDII